MRWAGVISTGAPVEWVQLNVISYAGKGKIYEISSFE